VRPEAEASEPVAGARVEIRVAARDVGVTPGAALVIGRRADAARGRNVLILGTADALHQLGRTLGAPVHNGGPPLVIGSEGHAPVLHRLREERPDEVYLLLGDDLDENVAAGIGAALLMDGVDVHLVVAQDGAPAVSATAWRTGGHDFLSLRAVQESPALGAVRRALDVAGAALLLVLLAPLFAAVAALVWWKMGRPIFFAQQRMGRLGRPFRLYKFRSMVPGADRLLHDSPTAYARYVASNYKLPDDEDERITPLGRFLRGTSLDELPQLVNVLRGDMSLVGPRPVVPEEVAEYGRYARMVLRVKPGLTGAWQVNGRNSIKYPERARMDVNYVAERSLGQDIGLLLRTLPAVIRRPGVP
jgi:exopolysaccharide production protein ExoY